VRRRNHCAGPIQRTSDMRRARMREDAGSIGGIKGRIGTTLSFASNGSKGKKIQGKANLYYSYKIPLIRTDP
jgi:hypothetical protein